MPEKRAKTVKTHPADLSPTEFQRLLFITYFPSGLQPTVHASFGLGDVSQDSNPITIILTSFSMSIEPSVGLTVLSCVGGVDRSCVDCIALISQPRKQSL